MGDCRVVQPRLGSVSVLLASQQTHPSQCAHLMRILHRCGRRTCEPPSGYPKRPAASLRVDSIVDTKSHEICPKKTLEPEPTSSSEKSLVYIEPALKSDFWRTQARGVCIIHHHTSLILDGFNCTECRFCVFLLCHILAVRFVGTLNPLSYSCRGSCRGKWHRMFQPHPSPHPNRFARGIHR